MKRFSLLFLIVACLVLFSVSAGGVSAALDNAESSWAFEEGSGTTAIDDGSLINDGTINGAVYSTGIVGDYSLLFDGTDDYVQTSNSYDFVQNTGDFTVSVWVNLDDTSGDYVGLIAGTSILSSSDTGFIINYDNRSSQGNPESITMSAFRGISADPSFQISTSGVITDLGWHHVAITGNSSSTDLKMYIDGSEVTPTSETWNGLTTVSGANLQIGDSDTASDFWDGSLDQLMIYDRPLTSSEISTLANASTGNPYAVSATNFSITAQDSYTSASLSNFSASLSNGTDTLNYNTTSGTISTSVLQNSSSLWNITVDSTEAGGYYQYTYTNYNVSSNLQASIYQSIIEVLPVTNRVSGEQIYDFQSSTSSNGGSATGYIPTSGSIILNGRNYLNVSAANDFTVQVSKSGYYSNEVSGINTSPETKTTASATLYDHRANFTLDVLGGGATDQNFTVDIYSDDYDFHEQLSTTSGNILANLSDGDYTVWLNDTIHALQSYNVTLNNSVNLTQVTLDSYTTNTVDVRFVDEETNSLVDNRTVTAFFTAPATSYNRTTTNGTMQLEMINPQDYTVTYEADGYTQRTYEFTLTNRTYNELTLYLLNDTVDELILVTVQDNFLNLVPGATVRAQRKNLSSTNYYTVETCTTDNNGECLLHLILYDPTYRFLIEVDGNVVLTSEDQQIKQTSLLFRVNLDTQNLDDINEIYDVTGTVTYDSSSEEFTYVWNDQNSLGVEACLEITARQGANTRDYNSSCTTSASGTITLPIDTSLNYIYEADGYVTIDGQRYLLDSASASGSNLGEGLGLNGLFIFGFLVIGIAAFTGLWNPVVGPIIIAGLVWFLNYISFINVGTAAVTSLAIGAVMVAYLSRS